MLWQSWCLLDSAQRVSVIRRQCVHSALIAGRHIWHNNASLPLEPLCATIDQERGDALFALLPSRLIDSVHHRVYPAARLHIVQSSDNDLELLEEILIKVLHRLRVRVNRDPLYPIHDKSSRHMRLVLANISFPEQKLPVQICHIDLVQIDHVNILDAREGQVFEYFTSEASSPYDQHTRLRILHALHNVVGLTRPEICFKSTRSVQNPFQVTPLLRISHLYHSQFVCNCLINQKKILY